VHARAGRFFFYRLLRLFFGADEKDSAFVSGYRFNEVVGFLDLFNCLLQVDNVDAVSFGEDKPCHFGVPAARLVTEVNARLE
jgi:hypothetical protein